MQECQILGGGHLVISNYWGGTCPSSMVHGEKERGWERVELPDSLMYEAVLQSAGFN